MSTKLHSWFRVHALVFLLAAPAAVRAQFNFTTNDGSITITGYAGSGGAVVIPDKINGLPVTSIGDLAFNANVSLTSVTLSTNVTGIGNEAFANCTNLANVTLDLNAATIGEGAFYDTSLTKMTIPAKVNYIDVEAFQACGSLTNIAVDAANSFYSSVAGVLFNKSQTVLVDFPGGVGGLYTTPNSVTSLGDFSVELCANLTQFVISPNVTGIGQQAFHDCYGLINVTIPASVTSIGQEAFSFCTNLVSVAVTNGVIGPGAFDGCISLTSVTLANGVASLANTTFVQTGLTNVLIPASVTNIDQEVFNFSPRLIAINVAPQNAFYSSVGGVLFDKSQTTLVDYPGGLGGNYAVPDGVANIENNAFEGSSAITGVEFPGSVSAIGELAFASSTLNSVIIPASVNFIGLEAFAFCQSLTNACFAGNLPATTALPPFSFENVFQSDPLTVIDYVAGATGWGSSFQGTPTAVCAQCGGGTLQVILNPPEAVSAGAQWQLDGGAFQDSGTVLANVSVGNHTLSFNTVSGWITPADQTVTVDLGSTNTATATYLSSVGAVQVNLGPADAVSAGAQWQLDDGTFQDSGAVLANVSVGDHTLSFNTVSGWVTPANQTVTVALGVTNTASATYVSAVGSIQVNLGPPDAVSAGAQWQLDGGAFQNSGAVLNNVSVGNHTLSFNTVSGWLTPGNQTAAVDLNTTNSYSATYTIAPGAVSVTIFPAAVVTAGARWTLDGGISQKNGGTVANVSTGDHVVAFTPVSGWITPSNQTVSVMPGNTATATASYVPIDGLRVTLLPSCAVLDGAQWQVDGGALQNSGVTVTNLTAGPHVVSFNSIAGWTAPANQNVTVNAGGTATATGSYRETSNPGTIVWINAGANQNWSNPANWDLNRVPTNTDIVLIPHVTGTNCVLDVNAVIAGLQIGDCAEGGSDGLDLHGQTLAVNGPITIESSATFTLADFSTLLVTNTVLTGTLDWQSATIAGTLTLGSNSVLNIDAASNYHRMGNCLFTNYGTVNWRDDILYGGGATAGTVFYNYGLWNAEDDRTMDTTFFGGSIVFDNFGVFRKSGGSSTGQTLFFTDVTFNNTGTLDVQQGNFLLQGGGSFTGGFSTTNATGTIILGSGSYNVNGTVTGTNFVQNGGNLSGASVLSGGLTWLSGAWTGSVTIAGNSVVNLTGASNDHMMGNCLVTNYGTVNWSQDILYAGGSSPATVIYNYGLWNAQDDRAMNTTFFGGSIGFDNFGVFRKSGGSSSGQTSFSTDVTFNSTGTLDVQAGMVNLMGAYSLTGGTLGFGFNDPTNYGQLTLNGSAALGGPLKVNAGGTFAPTNGSQFQIIYASGESGAFSSLNLPAGLSVNYGNSGVFLTVVGTVPVQILSPQLAGTNLQFQFQTANGGNYVIQRNDDLTTTNWVFYTNITGNGSVYQFQTPVTPAPAKRFFRFGKP